MKKLILMSALCLSLGLTACGGDKGGKNNGTDTTSAKTKDSTTSTKPDTSNETAKDSTSSNTTDSTKTGDSTKTDTTKK